MNADAAIPAIFYEVDHHDLPGKGTRAYEGFLATTEISAWHEVESPYDRQTYTVVFAGGRRYVVGVSAATISHYVRSICGVAQ